MPILYERQAAAIVNSGWMDFAPILSDRFLLRDAEQVIDQAEGRTLLKIVIDP